MELETSAPSSFHKKLEDIEILEGNTYSSGGIEKIENCATKLRNSLIGRPNRETVVIFSKYLTGEVLGLIQTVVSNGRLN